MRISLLLVFLLSVLAWPAFGRIREGECEVCLKRIGDFQSELKSSISGEAIESGIKRMCATYTDKADQRFCFYIGGAEDSATSLLRMVSSAMLNHLPPLKICDKLKSADGQICAVKYEAPPKPIDWATVDLNKMRVRELKQILERWGEKCDGCTDKSDYVRAINQCKHKHVNADEL